MKISPSPRKLSKVSTSVSFLISFALYAIGFGYFLLREDAPEPLAQAGTTKVTMSLASINTNSKVKTNAESAKPKEEPKEKPKKEEPKKEEPKKEAKPKPKPKPKPEPKSEPKPEPKVEEPKKEEPKEEPKKEEAKEEAKEKSAPKQVTTKDVVKEKDKQEESNKTSEGATSEAQAYNPGVSNEFLMKIQTAISSKNRYPKMAQIRGIEGEVLVSFTINADGSVTDIKVVKSNTTDILNHAALEAIKSAAHLFPKPDETVHLKIPIAYSLKED
ncbi:energy transducer TonB family protein [Helicobacter pylori]|uniref:energy transducer TonB family protein n=1 Tax=Helicobacter pylori TaxID=210 RepID=UPI000EAFC34F|nr:energy transducer TonB [Helicobacter pylori]RKV47977.1 energy transducer TonB [Helicobacter pylori]